MTDRPALRLAAAAALALGTMSAVTAPTLAQAGAAPDATAAADPLAVAAIARELNCPLCQGYNLQDCPLQVCAQMRQQIGRMLDEGQSAEAIRARFVADYGPQVLNRPPRSGMGLLAWFGPPLALLVGFLALGVRRRLAAPRAADGPAVARAPDARAAEPPGPDDALDRRLAELVDEDGT